MARRSSGGSATIVRNTSSMSARVARYPAGTTSSPNSTRASDIGVMADEHDRRRGGDDRRLDQHVVEMVVDRAERVGQAGRRGRVASLELDRRRSCAGRPAGVRAAAGHGDSTVSSAIVARSGVPGQQAHDRASLIGRAMPARSSSIWSSVQRPTTSSPVARRWATWACRHLTPTRVPPTPPNGRGPTWSSGIAGDRVLRRSARGSRRSRRDRVRLRHG